MIFVFTFDFCVGCVGTESIRLIVRFLSNKLNFVRVRESFCETVTRNDLGLFCNSVLGELLRFISVLFLVSSFQVLVRHDLLLVLPVFRNTEILGSEQLLKYQHILPHQDAHL